MTIRPAREEDLPALLEIYNYEVEHGAATLDLNPRTPEEWKSWYSNHQSDTHFILVSEKNDVLTGYASLSEYRQKEAYSSTAELSVYISPDHRRQGAASALMGAVLDRARECGKLHSVVSVITAGNEASEKLHRKFGFTFCGTLHQVGFKNGKFRDIDNFELMLERQE
ncbi:MAG: N-acetyltransferase [Oscillospiraceae bacterium]|nr:N-acetyltransferase [Oscillospiraceae bacterium]